MPTHSTLASRALKEFSDFIRMESFGGILLARALASPETRDQLLHSLVAAVRPQLRPEQAAEPESGVSSTHTS